MSTFQYYSTITPTNGELVLVVFTKKSESFFDAKLIEYPFRGLMNYSDASKKRKITSWGKFVQLDKPMVARVDAIDEDAKIATISIAYLDEYFNEKNLTPSDIQNKLMASFTENKLMESFITSVCMISQSNFDDVWTSFVHVIDAERRTYNDDEDNVEQLSIWQFFCQNFDDKIDEWCSQSKLSENIIRSIKSQYAKRSEKVKKIISTIQIISKEGVTGTKKLLDKCLTPLKYQYTFRYISAPQYIFETSTADTTQDDHHELVKNLKMEIQNMGLTLVFVQALPNEIAKIIE